MCNVSLHVYVYLFLGQSGETETLSHRLEEAEKALALKQAHIDKLKEDVEQQRALQETIEVLTAQVSRQKNLQFSLMQIHLHLSLVSLFSLAGFLSA